MCRIGLVVVVLLSIVFTQDNVYAGDILESPYMAAILFQDWRASEFRYRCNGAIISVRHVLTTATCAGEVFSFGDIKVRVGSSFHNRGGQIYSVEAKRKHFKFSPDLDADIAVLQLSQQLKLCYRIAVVNLPEQDAMIYGSWSNAKVVYYTDDKSLEPFSDSLVHIPELKYITNHVCNSHFRKETPFQDLVTENMICVGLFNHNLINFEPRGALLVLNGTVYGIYSWDRTSSDSPSVFTRVSAFSKWIKN